MSSRADYLARYMSGSETKTKKKKKSRKSKESNETKIIVDTPVIREPVQEEIPEDDPEDEMVPTKVDLSSTKPNKGFKRIDTGEHITKEPEAISNSELTEQPQTVYRDSSGRIVDINQRKQEFDERKSQQQQNNQFTEIRLNEIEQQQQSKVQYQPQDASIDDPMTLFEPNETKVVDDYSYTKGTNPINRYNIKAGYFWDGIDRSNGFEQLKLRQINQLKYNKLENSINQSYQLELDD